VAIVRRWSPALIAARVPRLKWGLAPMASSRMGTHTVIGRHRTRPSFCRPSSEASGLREPYRSNENVGRGTGNTACHYHREPATLHSGSSAVPAPCNAKLVRMRLGVRRHRRLKCCSASAREWNSAPMNWSVGEPWENASPGRRMGKRGRDAGKIAREPCHSARLSSRCNSYNITVVASTGWSR
jgi:hypothetical protein